MNFENLQKAVCQEISQTLSKIKGKEVSKFTEALLSSERIFVMGVGRAMLMMQAFAKRLKHLGFDSWVVGETVVPPISDRDVLIVGSGSGETSTSVAIARRAQKIGAKVVLITASEESTLRKIADFSVRIPAPTKLKRPDEPSSQQHMANLFEQALLIFTDCAGIILQQKGGLSEDELLRAHANLE